MCDSDEDRDLDDDAALAILEGNARKDEEEKAREVAAKHLPVPKKVTDSGLKASSMTRLIAPVQRYLNANHIF